MNLNKVRLEVLKILNNSVVFIYKGSRGQDVLFRGKVVNVYPRIFIVLCEDGSIKSFSYSDYAIGNLKIS